jgi:hypothetical protein
MLERRIHPRKNIHCRVFFECSDVKSKEVSQDIGLALDISEKGMLLESSRPIHASTIKVFSLTVYLSLISLFARTMRAGAIK